MVELNAGRCRPAAVIDLCRVPELRQWRTVDGEVLLGAGVTYATVLRRSAPSDVLAQASRTVGSPQVRARGTVGGNLGTASPAGDALPVLAAYDADVILASAAGTRFLPWNEFLVGPKRTAILPGELIVGARWPVRRQVGSFSKVGVRNAMVIAVVSLALVLDEDTREIRAALGSVGPTVLRAREAERFAASALAGAGVWQDPAAALAPAIIEEFGALVAAAARPIDDPRGTAAYRRHACAVLAGRALGWLLGQRPVPVGAA